MQASEVWIYSLCLFAGYCAESIPAALLGPVLPDLESGCSLGVGNLALLIPALGAGGALGAGLAGRLFDYSSRESAAGELPSKSLAFLAILLAGVGISNLLRTCSTSGLAATYFAHGIFTGAFRAGANWAILRIHPADQVAPFLQTLHFSSGVGRLLASLLGTVFAGSKSLDPYAFWVASAPSFLVSTIFALASIFAPTHCASIPVASVAKVSRTPQNENKPAEPGNRSVQFYTLVLAIALLTMGIQNTMQSFVSAYAVVSSPPLEFNDTSKAAWLSVLFSGAFALGRLLAVPAAAQLSALHMITCSLCVIFFALIALVAAPTSSAMLKVASTALGFAFASLFPSILNYAKQVMGHEMNGGKISGLMLAGTAGQMTLPHVSGMLLGGRLALPMVGEIEVSDGPAKMIQACLVSTVLSILALLLTSKTNSFIKSRSRKID